MVIDMHVHPILFGPICEDKKKVEFRKQEFGLYKSSPIPMSQVSDPTFSQEILGKGVAIIPEKGRVVAPVDLSLIHI